MNSTLVVKRCLANRSRITFGILKLRGKLKEKSFGIYELRDIILQVHYCNYSYRVEQK